MLTFLRCPYASGSPYSSTSIVVTAGGVASNVGAIHVDECDVEMNGRHGEKFLAVVNETTLPG